MIIGYSGTPTSQDIPYMRRISLSQDRRIALLAEYLAGARIDFLAAKYGVHRSYPQHEGCLRELDDADTHI